MCTCTTVLGECVFAYELWGTLGFRAYRMKKGRTSGPHRGYCRDKGYDGKEKPKNKREGSPDFDKALFLEANWQLDIFQSVGINFYKLYTKAALLSAVNSIMTECLWDNDKQAHYTALGRSLTQNLESIARGCSNHSKINKNADKVEVKPKNDVPFVESMELHKSSFRSLIQEVCNGTGETAQQWRALLLL